MVKKNWKKRQSKMTHLAKYYFVAFGSKTVNSLACVRIILFRSLEDKRIIENLFRRIVFMSYDVTVR